MFHSIFITTESGVCLFEKHFLKRETDSQLISGFISALGSFASEALGSGMQSLKLQTEEQLFVYPYSETNIIGIAITGARDNSTLVRKLLLKILTEFSTIFKRQLEKPSDVSDFQEFRYTVDIIIEGKVSSRTGFKMFLGVFIAVLLMGVILLTLAPLLIEISDLDLSKFGLSDIGFSNGLDALELQTLQTVTLAIIISLMGFFCILFFLPTFLAAYIAGNRRRGIWTALLIGVAIGLLTLIGNFAIGTAPGPLMEVNAFLWYIAFSPLLISISIICGIYGGRLKERRKLYPLEEQPKMY